MKRRSALAAVLLLTACATTPPPRGPVSVTRTVPVLLDAHGLDGFRAVFTAADGRPRLVLLLSPT